MNRPFKFFLLIFAIQRYRSVDCYAPGSLIWCRNLQEFIPIANVSTFGAYEQEIVAKSQETGEHNFEDDVSPFGLSKQEIVAESRKNEKHNFQGEVLNLAYFQDYNMVHFIANNTKVTGACGEIWNTLAEYSNFTLKTTRVREVSRRGEWRLVVNYLISKKKIQIVPRMAFTLSHSNIMDYTTPIWQTRCRIYIKPEWKSDGNWIFNIFERKVWLAILLCFLLLSAIGFLMQNVSIKVSGDKKRRHNLHDHLFYTFGTLCSRGSIPETLDRRSKILDASKKIFAGLLLIVLSSHVMSRMTNVKLRPPFEDVASLLNETKYTIAIYENSPIVDEYWVLINNSLNNEVFKLPRDDEKPRVWTSPWRYDLHETACDEEKVALFELEDTKQVYGNRFCKMVAVGKSYFPTWVTFGVSKGFKYKRTFDIGILKMKEFGLIDRLKNRWMKTSVQTVHPENRGHARVMPITLDQVLMLFIILGIGMAASATIFVLEVIVSIYKSNQRRPVSEKQFVGKDALNTHRLPLDNYKENRMRRGIELSEVSTRTIYVANLFVVDPNGSRARDNEYPHHTFYN